MSMKKVSVILGVIAASGIAWACVQNIFSGAVVEVTEDAIALAAAQGYSNPVRAAALAALDEWGSAQYGSRWVSEGFMGNFTARYRSGAVNTVFDKPCGQMAVREVSRASGGGGVSDSGGGGGGGTGTGGGGIIGGGGGWACTSAAGGRPVCRFFLF